MADYYPLIAKAVAGLEKSTGETRRALYDRARTALLAQLRGVEPALSEPDITRERLALEEAIRKVEGEVAFQRSPETARRSRSEPPRTESPPAAPSQDFSDPASGYRLRTSHPVDDGDDPAAETEEDGRSAAPLSAAATARVMESDARRSERWIPGGSSLSDNGARGFREGVGEAGSQEDDAVRAYRVTERSPGHLEQKQAGWTKDGDAGADRKPESSPALARLSSRDVARAPTPLVDQDGGGQGRALQSFPRIVRPDRAPERSINERVAPTHPGESAWSAPRNTNRVVAVAVIGLLALGIVGVAFWFGDDIMSSMHGAPGRTADQAAPADGAPASSKITDRAPSLAATEATASQKVVLYEEDPANPNGTQFVGTANWRTERASPSAGQKPDIFIRGDIQIPDQKLSVRLSLRRNEDKQLPASHTVEIVFTLPPDFPHGGIASIPGIMVKQGETNRGIALNGVAVKVTDNYFLVGLSSADAEMQRNVQLLKERSWFDIPIVYGDGKRALIAIEKGPPGERAFAEAFGAWEQQPQP